MVVRVRDHRRDGKTTGSTPGSPTGDVPVADWYVDSVAGSDAAAGTSAAPFATLAKVGTSITANPTKTSVALKRGSLFREVLPTTVVSTIDYGTGALPIIDGSNVITGWTVNGGNAVWEKTVTIETGGRPRIYEDGVLMPWVADLATCGSTAGSRVLLDAGGTVTLQMHPTGGGNPNSNGKTYEATVRNTVVFMGDNCTLKGVHARRCVHNDGSIRIGNNAHVERCIASDGSKHNMLINGGTMIDVILARADAVTPTEASNVFLIGFDGRGIAGQSISMQRVGFLVDGQGASTSFFCHDDVAGAYDSVTAEQVWRIGDGSFAPTAGAVSVQGYYAEQCLNPIGGGFSSQMTVDCFQVKNTGFGSDTGIYGLGIITNLTPQYVRLTNGALYSEGANEGWVRVNSIVNGAALTINNTTFATSSGASRTFVRDEGWTSGSLIMNGTILQTTPYGTYTEVPTGITYTADNNVFSVRDDGQALYYLLYHGASFVTSLAQWQTATGQDAHSFFFFGQDVAQLLSGTYSAGDYRLAGTGIGASASAINAGPQFHWDWNSRSKVSGPPTAWPNVPKTLANALTYIANPTGWTW